MSISKKRKYVSDSECTSDCDGKHTWEPADLAVGLGESDTEDDIYCEEVIPPEAYEEFDTLSEALSVYNESPEQHLETCDCDLRVSFRPLAERSSRLSEEAAADEEADFEQESDFDVEIEADDDNEEVRPTLVQGISTFSRTIEAQGLMGPEAPPESLMLMRRRLLLLKKRQGNLDRCHQRVLACGRALMRRHESNFNNRPGLYTITDLDEMGPTPPPASVVHLFYSAENSKLMNSDREAWKVHVVGPLIDMAFRADSSVPSIQNLVKAAPCPAAISGRFHPPLERECQLQNIDYCIYVDSHWDFRGTFAADAILALRKRLPDDSINPTAYSAFWDRPIAVPIRVRRSGETLDEACFQVAAWLQGQINFIDYILHGDVDFPRDFEAPSLDELEYIPGIVIVGTMWYLIAAEPQSDKTVVWFDVELGTTDTVCGMYRIIAGLQLVRHWIKETYWPFLVEVLQWVEANSRLPTSKIRYY